MYCIIVASQIALDAGADFVKTSTGFSSAGASLSDVSCLSLVAHSYAFDININIDNVNDDNSTDRRQEQQGLGLGIKTCSNAIGANMEKKRLFKASGGIRDGKTAIDMIMGNYQSNVCISCNIQYETVLSWIIKINNKIYIYIYTYLLIISLFAR